MHFNQKKFIIIKNKKLGDFMRQILLLLQIIISFSVYAIEDSEKFNVLKSDEYALKKEKNGINLEKITKNFSKNYQFISVHYRDDKDEIRLIYGNKLAMEGINSKGFKYKDGAILYKVVYRTLRDPSFHSSLVPEDQPAVRQIMLRDSKKFKDTNGWGYAVFHDDAKTLPGSPDTTLSTCYACHKLASARNDVFSWPMNTLEPSSKPVRELSKIVGSNEKYSNKDVIQSQKLSEKLFKFSVAQFSTLDREIQLAIDSKNSNVNILTGEMMNEDFPGYMTELNSFLIKETRKNGLPSVAFKKFNDRLIFAYSFYDDVAKDCPAGKKSIRYGVGSYDKDFNKNFLKVNKKCFNSNSAK